MINDKSRNTFWKEKKKMSRNPVLESLIIKDEQGMRQYDPEKIKEHTAKYYENLYKKKDTTPHPYHQEVQHKITTYMNDGQYEELEYNMMPTEQEIMNIITNKQNGKSTTDIKNEMLKRPGKAMLNVVYPMIKTIWKEEKVPRKWNTGQTTSIWKGKGDREVLDNHRGITTSSAYGTIYDALLDSRIERIVPMTQAQGGGRKGASTCDHLFLIRAIIDISIKLKKPTYLTFYDVSKAYDNIDNNDLLVTMWDKGLKGKIWRILKLLSTDLKASIKTRFGPTKEIIMEIGGKQGSRLTGRMFGILIDLLKKEFEAEKGGFVLADTLTIPVLLWVDDVVTCTEGEENQINTLNKVNTFAIKHKLKWGQHKCNVMRTGKHKDGTKEWNLGNMKIQETTNYKYLGDILTGDGKNTENIKSRKNKLQASTASISTIATSEILHRIETSVLLELHEKINIPSLLSNSESWILNKGDQREFEKVELQSLKNLFDLPIHTPTAAIMYSFGTVYASYRVDERKLMYLHRILNREESHWTRKTLSILETLEIGWSKNIKEILRNYELPSEYTTIKNIPHNEWKTKVKKAIEIQNTRRLNEDCHKHEDGITSKKTKTASIVDKINDQNYRRKPQKELLNATKQETKTIIIARYGMLECGKNFKGSLKQMCEQCNDIDDEHHRINHCPKWKENNLAEMDDKIDFNLIYANDIVVIRSIIPLIECIWNTKTAHGTMKSD